MRSFAWIRARWYPLPMREEEVREKAEEWKKERECVRYIVREPTDTHLGVKRLRKSLRSREQRTSLANDTIQGLPCRSSRLHLGIAKRKLRSRLSSPLSALLTLRFSIKTSLSLSLSLSSYDLKLYIMNAISDNYRRTYCILDTVLLRV